MHVSVSRYGAQADLLVRTAIHTHGTPPALALRQVNCITDGKVLPWEGRRYHQDEKPVADICLSAFVGAVQVCEPGAACAAGAQGGGVRGEETECYRDRDGRLFLTRPEEENISGSVFLLIFMTIMTCGCLK